MTNVVSVLEKISKSGDHNAILNMEDGREIWTPSYDVAVTLVGKPIPDTWFIREGEYGPQALPPKGKDSQSKEPKSKEPKASWKDSWYNSEVGVRFTQERMDRRTALMQAVEAAKNAPTGGDDILQDAQEFYDWLRETSPAGIIGEGAGAKAEGAPSVAVGAGEQTNSPVSDYPPDWPSDERS